MTARRSIVRVALLAACTSLASACVPYPVYKTLQPEVDAKVVDAAGAPVAQARVTLVARAHPALGVLSAPVAVADAQGAVHFDAMREWRVEVMALHGALDYYWSLCAAAPGYRTIEVPVQEGGVQRLTLKPGIPVECPAVGNDKTIWSEESDAARR